MRLQMEEDKKSAITVIETHKGQAWRNYPTAPPAKTDNVVSFYGEKANKYHEDLSDLVSDLMDTQAWSRARTHVVSIVAQIMANEKVPMEVRDRAYRVFMEYGSVALCLQKYLRDKNRTYIDAQEFGKRSEK